MTDEEDKPTFTADDLSHLKGEDNGGGDDGDKGDGDKQVDQKATEGDKGQDKGQDKAPADKGKTIATGADTEDEKKASDEADTAKAAERTEQIKALREALAKHASAGDKKAYDRELRRLERLGIEKPEQIYGLYREAEAKLTSGGLIKKPGKDAKPEEIAEYHKALGVPDNPEDYFKDLKLENGAVVGDDDKPMLSEVAGILHKAGAPPTVANAIVNWYYQRQEQLAADMDEADDTFRRESESVLKEELGAAFKRTTSAVKSLFAKAPGGTDAKNPNSLISRILGGRTADGRLIGNDPDALRWLIGFVNPEATLTEDGHQNGQSIDTMLGEIRKLRQTDPKKYWSEPTQARERELLDAQIKIQARQRA